MTKIAVIGATGMLGQPVTKEFINAGFEVSLLVRNINKAKQIFGSTVRLVEGDLKDIDKLNRFLNEQDGLYLSLSVEQKSNKTDFQPERDGLDNILEAAKNSTIKRVGYLSSLVHLYQGQNDFDWWVFDIKQMAVAKIKGLSLAYSIFYPSTFMESFEKGAYRQRNSIALAGNSKYKMFLISGSDYGKQVVKAFQFGNGNHDYVVQGQDGYTADEAAKFYVDHYTKRKIKIIKARISLLKFFGYFTNTFNYGARIIEALNNYPEKFEAEKTWKDLGKPQTKFIDYIKQS